MTPEARSEMTAERAAVVNGWSVDLVLSCGFPDVRCRYDHGHLRPVRAVLMYGMGGGVTAHLHGFWVPGDGTSDWTSVTNEYKAPGGDTSLWPDWLAALARIHAPAFTTDAERAVLQYALELAGDQMASRANEFTDDDRAALASLKRRAGEEATT